GKVLVSSQNLVRLWDVATGRPLGTPMPHDNPVWFMQFHPNGRLALTGELNNACQLWDVTTGQRLGKLEPPGPLVGYRAVYSPDGARIATAPGTNDAGQVIVWDTTTLKPDGVPLPHPKRITALTFTADNRAVA